MANAAGSRAMDADRGAPAVGREAVSALAGRQAFEAAGMSGALAGTQAVNANLAGAGPSDRRFYNPPGWKADEGRQYHQLRRDGNYAEAAALKAQIDARKGGDTPPGGER